MNDKELKSMPLIQLMEHLKRQVDYTLDMAKHGQWFVQDAGPELTGLPNTRLMEIGDFVIHARFSAPEIKQ